ncbi:MAG: hypothetical protein HY000_10805 [Planctomycetes bacterium]|nr:hypothetical protein [Planctomycetota bacterium]
MRTGLVVASLVLAFWIGAWAFVCCTVPSLGGRAAFAFDSLNALFSGFALLGVVWAIVLQKRELELQREELRHAREAHEQAAAALAEQAETARFHAQLESFNLIISGLRRRLDETPPMPHRPATDPIRMRREELHVVRDRYETYLQKMIDERLGLREGIRVTPPAERSH